MRAIIGGQTSFLLAAKSQPVREPERQKSENYDIKLLILLMPEEHSGRSQNGFPGEITQLSLESG